MNLIDSLNWRYATKKFNGTAVPEADVRTIAEAIRLAPSSAGTQPYHVVVASGELKDSLIRSSGQVDKLGASHMLVFCSRIDYPARAEKQIAVTAETQGVSVESLAGLRATVDRSTVRPPEILKEWAARQAYIALGIAVACAAELRVDACPMEGFNPDEFKAILGLPEYMNPVVIMALGYRDPEDRAAKRAKVRFPFDDLFEFRE